MMREGCRGWVVAAWIGVVWPMGAAAAAPTMTVHVDATAPQRKLMDSTVVITGLSPGPVTLWYPKYVPGNHAASGPVQNIGRMEVTGCNGERLHWDRSPRDQHRVSVVVPEGCDAITIGLTYITSQPSHISRSSDCYTFAEFGGINWNCLLWYPDGWTAQELVVEASLVVPPEWRVATSLDRAEACVMMAGHHCFAPVSLAELVDSPVLAGSVHDSVEHVTTSALDAGTSPHALHIASSDPGNSEAPDALAAGLGLMCREAQAVFGAFPRDRYEFLVLAHDGPGFGLEHSGSTYIAVDADEFAGADGGDARGVGQGLTVLPHEYIHAWCGKLAAPEGLVRSDYHTPLETELLWVYEGLTTYYTDVIAVRAGLLTADGFESRIAERMATTAQRSGRLWRSVEDTARDVSNVRAPSHYWGDMRRRADYYGEAALFWLEADAIIRRGTGGSKSLDDFCAALFAGVATPVGEQHAFTRADVVAGLEGVYGGRDWDALIRDRIERPVASLDMGYLAEMVGRRLEFRAEPSDAQRAEERDSKAIELRYSLGLTISAESGAITALVPGSPADMAGIDPDAKVIGIGTPIEQFTLTRDRAERVLRDAAGAGAAGGMVVVIAESGDRLVTYSISYTGGARWPMLAAVEGEADVLRAIASPRVVAPAPE